MLGAIVMRSGKQVYGLVLLAAIGTAVPAFAQSNGAPSGYPQCPAGKVISTEESDAAHRIYTAGRVDYDEGKTDSAITRFKEAYAKDCTKHEVLVIISRAYQQKNDLPHAIEALDLFLQRVPANYPERDTYEKRLKSLKDDEKKQPSAPASTPPPSTTGTPTATPSASAPTYTPPPPTAGEPRGHTAYPWILAGVGVALVIAGGIVVATAPVLPKNCDESSESCHVPGTQPSDPPLPAGQQPLPPCSATVTSNCYDLSADRNRAATAKNQPRIGIGIIAGGAVAIVGGLVWFLLEPTGPSKETGKSKTMPLVVPELGRGYAGLQLATPF